MTAVIIIGIIALIIIGLMMISIGVDISFIDEELTVAASFCGKKIQIFPRSPKKESAPKKEKKPKKQKEKKKSDEASKGKKGIPLDLNFEEILGLLKKVLKGLAKFKNFCVDNFMLHFLVAGYDPYNVAIFFGRLNAALSILGAYCKENLKIKNADVYTDVDFIGNMPKLDFQIAVSIRIGQIFGVINTILFGALGIVIKNRIRVIKERSNSQKEEKDTLINERENSDTSTNKEEERTNENGAE